MIGILKALPMIHGLILFFALMYVLLGKKMAFLKKVHLNDRTIMILLGGMTFVLAMAYTSSGHGWGDDFSEYIAQGRALAEGNVEGWMEKNEFIISNSQYGMGAAVYPWGTAFLLAPLYKIFGLNFTVFKAFESLCLAGAVMCLHVLYRRRFSESETVVLTLFTAWNPWVLKWADDVTAHIPCMFVILFVFVFLDAYVKENRRTLLRSALLGVGIFYAIQMRTVSLGVLLALFIVDMMYLWSLVKKARELSRKQWIYEVMTGAAPYVIFLVGTVLLKVIMPQAGGTYQSYFDFSPSMILANLKNYAEIYGLFFVNVQPPYFDKGLFFLLCSLGLWGLAAIGMVKAWKQETYYVLYTLITMAVLMVFIGTQATLYVFAVFPIVLMFAWIGAKAVLPVKGMTALKALSAGLLGTMVFWNAYSIWNIQSGRNVINTAYAPDSVELYDYINETIEDDEVIYFFKPRALYLNTDNYACWSDPEEEKWMLCEYMIAYPFDPEYGNVMDYVEQGGYTLLFENDTYQLYRNEKN